MPGWMAAAEMVAQHREMPDGRGYPQQLRGDAICPGAKILAIIDAFEAVMLKQQRPWQDPLGVACDCRDQCLRQAVRSGVDCAVQ